MIHALIVESSTKNVQIEYKKNLFLCPTFAFSMNHIGQFFLTGCYFLEIFGWNSRVGPQASDKVTNFHKFEHLCQIKW